MFRDKIELKDLDKMDAEYRELLGRVVTIQADCEIGGPHLYVKDILPSAPTKVDQLMVARTAAEEMDHFRKIARVAGDMGVDVSFVLTWPNQKRYLDAFRGIIKTWEDFAIFGFLIDRVGRYQLEEFRRLQLQTPRAHPAPDYERRNWAHRVRSKQDHRACGQGRRSEREGPRGIELLVCQGARHVWPLRFHPRSTLPSLGLKT